MGEKTAFANWKTWPNTLHANRVLLAADAQGLGGRLTDIICGKLYEEGENVSLRETVGAAAEEAGVVDGARLAASDEGLDELKAQLKAPLAGGKRVARRPPSPSTTARTSSAARRKRRGGSSSSSTSPATTTLRSADRACEAA